jgi:hypothetical protein
MSDFINVIVIFLTVLLFYFVILKPLNAFLYKHFGQYQDVPNAKENNKSNDGNNLTGEKYKIKPTDNPKIYTIKR